MFYLQWFTAVTGAGEDELMQIFDTFPAKITAKVARNKKFKFVFFLPFIN